MPTGTPSATHSPICPVPAPTEAPIPIPIAIHDAMFIDFLVHRYTHSHLGLYPIIHAWFEGLRAKGSPLACGYPLFIMGGVAQEICWLKPFVGPGGVMLDDSFRLGWQFELVRISEGLPPYTRSIFLRPAARLILGFLDAHGFWNLARRGLGGYISILANACAASIQPGKTTAPESSFSRLPQPGGQFQGINVRIKS